MRLKVNNIFSKLPSARAKENFRILQCGTYSRIERIVSCGQATPGGKWLCQKKNEWVMVLRGRARLSFKGQKKQVVMKAGDHVFIPKNTYHRVEWTHPRQKTVWLALHIA